MACDEARLPVRVLDQDAPLELDEQTMLPRVLAPLGASSQPVALHLHHGLRPAEPRQPTTTSIMAWFEKG